MERDLAGAKLSVQDFGRLAVACRDDPRFPANYGDWSALVAVGTRDALAQGLEVRDISIEVDDFVSWCHRVEVCAGLDALRAYLILIRRAQHVPRTADETSRSPSHGACDPAGGPKAMGRRSRDKAWKNGLNGTHKKTPPHPQQLSV